MEIKTEGTVTHMRFDSTLEYAEFSGKCPEDATARKSSAEKNRWSGGTYKQAQEQVRSGNPELVQRMFEGTEIVNSLIESEKNGEIRDVTGEYFDVSDFLSGEPEVFRRQENDGTKPVVPVWVNFGMLCDIEPETIINRGSAIVALVDELQTNGYIVDLRVVKGTDHFLGKIYCDIKLRTDPVDLDELAFLIANPLNLRRIWFGCLESWRQTSMWSMGSTVEYDLEEWFESGLSGFYFVGSSHRLFKESNYSSIENAKDHIMQMITQVQESAEQVILG